MEESQGESRCAITIVYCCVCHKGAQEHASQHACFGQLYITCFLSLLWALLGGVVPCFTLKDLLYIETISTWGEYPIIHNWKMISSSHVAVACNEQALKV